MKVQSGHAKHGARLLEAHAVVLVPCDCHVLFG